jgi:hypothetical protein
MSRSGELSDFKCGLVTGCHISKKSVRDLTTLLKLPKLTVGDMIVKWKCEGTTSMEPWPGWLRLMTDRDRRTLKVVVRDTCQTSHETITREFRSATNCRASTMTVYRELRGMGFHGRAAAHKPNILPVNAKRLLKWCKERRHWTLDNWKCVILGDESHYTMWQSNGRVWVWRIPASMCSANSEIWRRCHYSVGVLSWNGLGPFVILCGNLNTEGYKDILTRCILFTV